MAKKQTRRSISVSRTTYERLKAFCEANNISMSQFVETRVGDFLGEGQSHSLTTLIPTQPKPTSPAHHAPRPATPAPKTSTEPARTATPAPVVPMTSAAARYAVEPPPPIIKPRQETAAPKPAEKRPDQIFTF
jgi:hypothetical protein